MPHSGFLEDTQPWRQKGYRISLTELVDFPCLILLGEPGIGKSTELSAIYEFVGKQSLQSSDSLLVLNLRDYQSDSRLFDTLERDSKIDTWLNGNNRLFLFLDSLDEALMTINSISTALISKFTKWPIERLVLRIACRTADWPLILEQGLNEILGEEKVKIMELAPLNRSDILEAARTTGSNPEHFLQEIMTKEVEPLATIPVTLNFLLKSYSENGQIPTQKRELYENGCRLLCLEWNRSRISSHRAGHLTPEQRLIIAARIATLCIFNNRAAIWNDAETEEIPDSDINKNVFVGGNEQINGQEFSVGLQEIEETLGTALFSSKGSGRLGWSHQTYAEFLAAWYLIQHNFKIDQIHSLIVYPNDIAYLIPQLHETAAWIASFSREVFHEIMEKEPQILLKSDVATADSKDRAMLVDSLLARYEQEKIYNLEWQDHPRLAKLSHGNIADQLQPYICNPGKNIRARRFAINIAEACSVTQLLNDLVNVALNTTELEGIRVGAAYAVYRMGEGQSKARLKPLALGQAGEDPNDELKGCGLQCVWPEHISAEELFSILTPQKKENYLGSYARFINQELLLNLLPKDLPIALDWVQNIHAIPDISYSIGVLVNRIMIIAWENIDYPGVLPAFANAAHSRLSQSTDIFSRERIFGVPDELQPRVMVEKYNEKRHAVILKMLPMLINSQYDHLRLIYSGIPLILNKDLNWLIAIYIDTNSIPEKNIIASWICRIFDVNNPIQVEKVYYVSETDAQLGNMLKSYFDPVELNTPKAGELKDLYRKLQNWQRPLVEPPLLEPPLSERINHLLDKFEQGEINAWWVLNREMTLSDRSTHYEVGLELEWDLTKLPGWLNSDERTRERIIRSAKVYLQEGNPQTETWLGTDMVFRPAFSGYRALILLNIFDPGYLHQLPSYVWQKWAPMIISRPLGIIPPPDDEIEQQLIQLAYYHTPDELTSTLITLIKKENEAHGEVSVLSKVDAICDDHLASGLLKEAASLDIRANSLRPLLRVLLRHHYQPAFLFAVSLISSLSEESDRAKAIVAAQTLMLYSDSGGWDVISPVIQNNEQFGRDVMIGVADIVDHGDGQVFQHLTTKQLSDLYHWLIEQFPPEEDPDINGFHSISKREIVGEWRDSIITYLTNLATLDACEALQSLVKDYPKSGWLRRYLLEAETKFRRQTWIPPTPIELLSLIKDRNIRFVESGEQLLEVIIASLKRLEVKLHDETPAVIDVWNDIGKKRFQPKDENALSDYIKRHLVDDLKARGIIANREVEIRRTTGLTPGERTDIHIDAIKKTSHIEEFDIIKVIIEVKGCWNKDLDLAMKTQLKERYLKENQCSHGLYVIGWFQCQEWDDSDRHKRRCSKNNLIETQEKFNNQASSLCDEGTTIRSLVLNTALSSQ